MGTNPQGYNHPETIESALGTDAYQLNQFPSSLHSELTMCLEGNPFHIPQSVPQGNGFEAMRLIRGRYEPRTVDAKRGYFKAIVTTTLLSGGTQHQTLWDLVGRPLGEHFMVLASVEACVPELRTTMGRYSRRVSYREVTMT